MLILNKTVIEKELEKYDKVIICAYSSTNEVLGSGRSKINYQFKVCEKVVVQLPDLYSKVSIVILDGPFMCIDPLGNTGDFVIGDVLQAIHQSNIEKEVKVKPELLPLLNRGIIREPPITNFIKIRESASRYFHDFHEAKRLGSMFVIRCVFPGLESTDSRPTVITSHDQRVYSILSGKWVNCVYAARELATTFTDS